MSLLPPITAAADGNSSAAVPNPYQDYGRYLTESGGVLIRYKDYDLRWRFTLWRWMAWTSATGIAGWYLLTASPVHKNWLNMAALLIAAILNWIIVRKPIEIYRSVEIRPDCMIMNQSEIFWLHLMENGLPIFHQDDDGNLVLAGPYGTRFVEYLTARRFDENDRQPEVMAAHFEQAAEQLWAPAFALGAIRLGSPPGELP